MSWVAVAVTAVGVGTSAYASSQQRKALKGAEVPAPPDYPWAGDIFGEASDWAKENFPLTYGAREKGLAALPSLEVGSDFFAPYFAGMGVDMAPISSDYFNQFGPSSFEQALANEYFKTAQPEAEKAILAQLSRSGMAYSPIAAELIGRETGKLGVDIGQYLSGVGENRAGLALNDLQNARTLAQRQAELGLQGRTAGIEAQLNIDPMSIINPYASTALGLETAQAEADYNERAQQAELAFQRKLALATQQGELAKGIGNIVGTWVDKKWGGGGDIGSILSGGAESYAGYNPYQDITQYSLGNTLMTGGIPYYPSYTPYQGSASTLYGGADPSTGYQATGELGDTLASNSFLGGMNGQGDFAQNYSIYSALQRLQRPNGQDKMGIAQLVN